MLWPMHIAQALFYRLVLRICLPVKSVGCVILSRDEVAKTHENWGEAQGSG